MHIQNAKTRRTYKTHHFHDQLCTMVFLKSSDNVALPISKEAAERSILLRNIIEGICCKLP